MGAKRRGLVDSRKRIYDVRQVRRIALGWMIRNINRHLECTMGEGEGEGQGSRASGGRAEAEQDWREKLGAQRYHILREKGTERPFDNAYWDHKEAGVYRCAGCGEPLYSSEAKFDSGTGWPSFWQAMDEAAVQMEHDRSHGMVRTEVRCRRCGGHLGHVFDDGPEPTGKRHCINSASLAFERSQQ